MGVHPGCGGWMVVGAAVLLLEDSTDWINHDQLQNGDNRWIDHEG